MQLGSFVVMAPKQTDPQMVSLETSVQQVPTVRLGVPPPLHALQALTQIPRGMKRWTTVLTALVGITVKAMVTKRKQTSVMQGFTVLQDKKCGIQMVLSALLGISVQLVQKNLYDAEVELTRIISISSPVRHVVILGQGC